MKKTFLVLNALALSLHAMAQLPEPRVPVFEVFTSSTCGPCKPGNAVYEGVVGPKPATEYVSVKFQQNFPGTGDPYCTTETQSRRGFYSINSIPRMEIDGGWDQNAQSFTNALYTSAKAVAAQYRLSGAFTQSGKTITGKIKFTPLTTAAAAANTRLYIVIVETRTVNNVKSNGETEFFNVAKKMIPNQNGTTLNTHTINVMDSMTFTYTFNGNYRLPSNGLDTSKINHAIEHSVENFANLRVVAWVQASDKTIYQGANLMKVNALDVNDVVSNISALGVFPNPADKSVNIDYNLANADDITVSIVDMQGALVARKVVNGTAGANHVNMATNELPSGYYTLIMTDTKNGVAVEKLSVVH